jgi:micrococcal nuclease
MKLKVIIYLIFPAVLIISTFSTYGFLVRSYSVEIDEISYATNIVDGDTFDISSGDRIRLADVDTPENGEAGYYDAWNYLSRLIYNKRVYLDVDDVHVYDTLGYRLVCLVYLEYNSTHYLNINQALLESNLAEISDYDNEFNPYSWTLFEPKLTFDARRKLLGLSTAVGIATTLVFYGLYRLGRKLVLRAKRQVQSAIDKSRRYSEKISGKVRARDT